MDINGFLGELLREISHLDFVDSIDFNVENPLTHKSISDKSISDIIKALQKIYLRLQD